MALHVTRCPGCNSTFNTNPAVLAAAAGRVRCGACLTVFEAIEHFVLPDPSLHEDDSDSVFVSSDPSDYFDPSRFLTRRSLQERDPPQPPRATSEEPPPEPTPVAAPEPQAPAVQWGMGQAPEAGPEFAYPAPGDNSKPGSAPGIGETGDFFSAAQKGLPEPPTPLQESSGTEAVPPWVQETGMDSPAVEPGIGDSATEDGPWQSEDAVSDSPWTALQSETEATEAGEADTEASFEYALPLEPNYQTSSADSIVAAQEEFLSHSQAPPQPESHTTQVEVDDQRVQVQHEDGTGDENVAAELTEHFVLEDEPSDAEIRARALRTQFEDEQALEALPPENLSALGKVANTLELPLGTRSDWGRNIVLGLLALGLGALLAAQYLWRYQPLYALDVRLRPLYLLACDLLDCSLPEFRDITSIRSDGLTVRSHPERDNALVANITFQNTAAFPQPFPIMILSFNSAANSVIALREFSPEQYLPAQLQDLNLMPVGRPVQLSLELIDPGPDAVNYTLAFRRP